MQQRKIDAESCFAIYGAATTGAIIYRNLIKQGYRVVCFLDRRYEEIKRYLDLPVMCVKEFTEKYNKDTIVIIAVKNVFAHEDIASQFVDYGFHSIVYKTQNLIKGKPASKDTMLGELYDSIFEGKMIADIDLQLTESIQAADFKDTTQTEIDDEYVYAKIPAAFVFSDKYENDAILWNAVNVMGLIPHLDFFECIQGNGEKNYEDYLSYCYAAAERSGGILTSQQWVESVLENRIDIYRNMELERQFNPSFFDESAPSATLSENGIFHIHSGKHRMIYQVVNGKIFLTLKLTRKDYAHWKNERIARTIYRYLEEHKIRRLPIPVMNPYFYKFPCDNMIFYYGMQKEIVNCIYRYFYKKKHRFHFEDYTIYNNGMQGLILNPVLTKMGFHVYTDDCLPEKNQDFAELLYQLYRVNCPCGETGRQSLQENAQILITDKVEIVSEYERCEMIFAVIDYEETMENESGFYEVHTISAGFCDNKRKKVVAWMCR